MPSSNLAKRDNGKWRARYRDAESREHSRHFDKKADAQKWLNEVTASIVTGMYVDPGAGKVTLKKFATDWQGSHVGRDATVRLVDNAIRLHITPALGERPVASLRRSDIQGFVKTLSDSLAPGSGRNVYGVLNRVLAAAVDDRMISGSPCVRIVLPALVEQDVIPPTGEQVARLGDVIDPRYRGLLVLLAGSGLRIGEALGLHVADVSFLRRTVRVERQRLQTGLLGPPKTAKSVRTVPLGRIVIDELALHLAEYPSDDALFVTRTGEPLTYRQWKNVWAAALAATPLTAEERVAMSREALKEAKRLGRCDPLDFTTHDLRHFTASALISGGASVKQVQTVLGHSSAAITLKVYSHLWPGDDDRTRLVMDNALGPLADCLRTERVSEG